MRRKNGNKQTYGGKSIRPCDRKTVKQKDIRKQMCKGNVNFTTINYYETYYLIKGRKRNKNTFQRKI